MSPVDHLIEQHILEAELRQRHIDESTAGTPLAAQAAEVPPAGLPHRPAVAQGALETIGSELEKALAAVMDPGHR